MPRRPRFRSAPARQGRFAFLVRRERRERQFKRAIVALTALVAVGLVAGSPVGRRTAASLVERGREFALRSVIGLEPSDEDQAALRAARRSRTEEATRESLARFYKAADPAIRRMFDEAGMDPGSALIGVGRSTNGFLLSSKVFEQDDAGRSYRFRPNTAAVWLRQVTLHEGPFGLFLVPDTPAMRAAAGAAGAIVDEPSRQTTNSWGLRGPEPDPRALMRGIVLGDSFMEGMFNGDDDTPPLALQRALADLWGVPASILNTGHIGYAPEQYCQTLRALGDRFRPHFLVVSVCPNDFGDEFDVVAGRGDDWDEAKFWLGEILQWCRSRAVPCVLVPVPCDYQLQSNRKDAYYPGRISNLYMGSPQTYCDPVNEFLDENLRLYRDAEMRTGARPARSLLYNRHIDDNHFSPLGARLWARVVARRVDLLVKPPSRPGSPATAEVERR